MVTVVERIMGRRQIDRMLDDEAVPIVFRRRTKVDTPGGGWKWGTETALPAQMVCLIPFKRRMTDFLINTEAGEVANLPYVLVGPHDLDIQEGDLFTYQGDEFEVKTIDFKREIRTAAQVDYHGG